MLERAHPKASGFQDKWVGYLRFGLPWVKYQRSPYKGAFLWRYQWVSKYSAGMDVLDVPCGMGWGTSLIQGARSLVGVDLSEDAVAEAWRRYSNLAEFKCGDMGDLEFHDSSFDIVSCLEGIEHVPVEIGRRFFAEASRVLRPRGLLLVSSPYCRTKPQSGNPYHIHEYQPDEIRALLSERFSIESVDTRDVDNLTVLYLLCRKGPA